MQNVMQRINKGNSKARVKILEQDELGDLVNEPLTSCWMIAFNFTGSVLENEIIITLLSRSFFLHSIQIIPFVHSIPFHRWTALQW